MTIPILAMVLRVLWVLVENLFVRRNPVAPAKDWDRHSGLVWDAANLTELIGIALGFAGIGRMQIETSAIAVAGLVLLVLGILIRASAIKTLGDHFTYTVMVKDGHRLVRSGIYKHLRHPSYSGALLAHLGLGLCFSNWFTLAFSSIPFVFAAFYRMRVEEQALSEAFGAEYRDYSRSAKRLIPGLY